MLVFQVKRKGISVAETVILMLVVGLTFGAIFTTMTWVQKTYVFGKQEKESREVLFSWVQTFESLWPPPGVKVDSSNYVAETNNAAEKVGKILGTYAGGKARVGTFEITVRPTVIGPHDGSMELEIEIFDPSKQGGNKSTIWTRTYNVYTTEPVSDDVFGG